MSQPGEGSVVELLRGRIDELEMRVAFQEETLQSLDDVIASQGEAIAQQSLQLKVMADKFKSLTVADDNNQFQGDERPPHY